MKHESNWELLLLIFLIIVLALLFLSVYSPDVLPEFWRAPG